MAYKDVDAKAAKYEPTRVIRKWAERVGADISAAKDQDHARRLISEHKEKKSDTKAVEPKPLKGEVLPPLPKSNGVTDWHAPSINLHLPALHANVNARIGPQWFDCVGEVRNAVLYMVFGAALYVVLSKWLGL